MGWGVGFMAFEAFFSRVCVECEGSRGVGLKGEAEEEGGAGRKGKVRGEEGGKGQRR